MNETEKKYKQGDRVYFEHLNGMGHAWGKVCGVIGPVIIIELEVPFTNYEYTHIYILDAQITK
jgi:hypothetical protein